MVVHGHEIDAGNGLVHTITVTAANVHDVTQTEHLLRDDEVVYGNSGYIGIQERPEIANNEHFQRLISALTAVPVSCLLFLTMRSNGNGISIIGNPQYGVGWSTHSESSNASSVIRKRCTEG